MQGEIIQSFLVGLGFDVDDSSLAAFNKSIQTAALKVTALYASVNALAGGMVVAFAKISEGFEQMGYDLHLIAPSINKAIVLRNELLKAYSAAGINIQKVIVDSVQLNLSLTKTKYALEAIYKSVGSKFFGLLQKQSDTFRKRLYENMPAIIKTLTALVNAVFKALEVVTQLGKTLFSILSRVYDFFKELNDATNGWSTIILGVIAAWQLLNLEFLATPLGMVIAGLVAILALYDDFKVWQEGGKSFFNWGPVVPYINMVGEALSYLKGIFLGLVDVVGNVVLAFYQLYKGDKSGALDSLRAAGQSLIDVFSKWWDVLKGIVSTLDTVGAGAIGLIKGLFGGADTPAASRVQQNPDNHYPGVAAQYPGQPGAGSAPPNLFPGNPIGSAVAGASNVTANIQTSINVSGAADASSVGRQVNNGQDSVNRNALKYATSQAR